MTEQSSLLEATGSRTETDFMGPREIPAAAYWGIQTLRAVENFPITGRTISAYPHAGQGTGPRQARSRAGQL